ncbi:MAG: 30S ribosomal protein S6 [Bacteroides sp.]
MNHYETVFIATPVLSESQVKETVEKFRAFIVGNGGEIENEENWGLRKLAYSIKKKENGYYFLFQFAAQGDVVDKLETQFRRDERIIRFLTVRLDKDGLEYANKRRMKIAEGENTNKQSEEESK